MNKKWYSSGSFYGALVFALALWGYNSLSLSYLYKIQIPIVYNLPSNKAIKNNHPKEIEIMIRTNGWNLFSMILFGNNQLVRLNLLERINKEDYLVTKAELKESLENFHNIEPKEILTTEFELYFDELIEKKVALAGKIDIKCADGYKLLSKPDFNPKFLNVSGSRELISKIDKIYFKGIYLSDLKKSGNVFTSIDDSITKILNINEQKLKITYLIEPLTHIIINDVPLEIINKPNKLGNNTIPKYIDIIIEGTIDELKSVKKDQINAILNLNNYSGVGDIFYPQVTIENLTISKITPEFIIL